MPMAYTIDAGRKLVLTRAWGVLSDSDVLQHKATLDADPKFVAGIRELSDVREIERLAVTSSGVRDMIRRDKEKLTKPEHRLALVVASDVVYGMARMYALLRGEHTFVRVFRTLPEAGEWLDSVAPVEG